MFKLFFSPQPLLLALLIHRAKEIVANDADLYGMCLLGDGATIQGMPLMNVLVTTPNACSVLDIIDCTEHMEEGGKKDAKYIAEIFCQHIDELDPKGVHLNAVLFDGASNVQKAGRVIEAKYPQVSVLHGIEHVVSLFFADVARLPFLQFLILNYRRLYRVFGSGSMHGPYAIFQKQALTFNGGVRLGLIRAADNRMAGYFTAFHRMLRLKPALEATIASAEFLSLKLTKPVVLRVVAFLKDQAMWNTMHVLTRCLFPALRVLRLADKSEPGFDCLYYFIRRTDRAMDWSTRSFNSVAYFTTAVRDPVVMEDLVRNDGGPCDGSLEEDEYTSMLAQGYDDDDDDDEERDVGVTNATSGRDLGRSIMTLWNSRKVKMVSDFCIAGWLLSPLEEVMEDVRTNRTGSHTDSMDRIIKKMYYSCNDDELGTIMDKFWTEWDEFHTRAGRFGDGRKYIWNSELLRRRKSAKWHAQYSVPNTEVSVLFVFACFCLSSVHLTNSFCSCCHAGIG